ncbi:MAG: hypothetical protein K5982_04455 [Selenomonadaceae bacterium]|nr:hypothetical protein [Selenomonadaceae bacterium]
MLIASAVAIGLVVVAFVVFRLFFSLEKNSRVIVRLEKRSPFALESMTDTDAVLYCSVPFENLGGQYGTLVDCVVRPQLPFEQYDGIDARGKAEVDGKPREDDYFEAALVDAHSSLSILVKVRLTARKGMDIRTALSRMVDLPLDVIYTELSRNPWQLKKFRVILTAEEIASLAGVTLVDE